ncbi:DUF1376 domain-containing protein [Chryseobacterium carnipullorum]|uniref:DUF1376 domain-containing protein n=1 Tax=Chryseobacterium carnipullorum TaxID=1124835 RepID=A0A376DUD5_CHRCU|nr:DUF1376 domain-containing protein [Chryseobacterium carnipullorum]AZA49773.1 DUF1376 domain-containing protein [Chryseobacterium carnipullorum]AZA64665.1 DUF1376 domain-containing protein [Chryseobacterium carnipullorum]STC95678.1 Uncharacterized protein conserved in bacteria [Chryseobacterium carnipullorum]
MKDPAVLLYVNDWLNSTASMDSDCRGWYLNLILHNYDKGSLPNDIEKLAVLCNVKFSEFQRFQQVFEQVLKQKFDENEDGTISNPRTQQILRAREVFKDKRSDAGKKSYLSRYFQKKFPQQFKKKAIKEFVMDHLDTSVDLKNEQILEQMFEHVFELYRNENENEDVNKDLNSLKVIIPSENEFLEFVKSWMTQNNKDFESKKTQIITKYQTWVDAGWKDGFGNEIKNWKLKFQNVEPHLRKDFNNGQSNSFKTKSNGTGLRQSVER